MPEKGWVSVSLPEDLHEAAAKYVQDHPELGFSGVPELVRDLLRKLIRGEAAQVVRA